MDKYIYKITNLINGKVYVGQTNNIKRRFKEHIHDKRNNHPLYQAIKKYGADNFSYDILYCGSDYNMKEKYWIKKLKSNDKRYGYNIKSGGEDSSGEDNPMAKISQDKANEVINYLLNSDLSRSEIAVKVNLPVKYIDRINHGEAWKKAKYTYPLRKFAKRISSKTVSDIIALLSENDYSLEEIASKMKCSVNTVKNINSGYSYKRNNIKYPIMNLSMSREKLDTIIYMLTNTNMYYREIAKETNTTVSIVSKINLGKTWHNDKIQYPIRKKIVVRSEHD